jgi:hypothetical protein
MCVHACCFVKPHASNQLQFFLYHYVALLRLLDHVALLHVAEVTLTEAACYERPRKSDVSLNVVKN